MKLFISISMAFVFVLAQVGTAAAAPAAQEITPTEGQHPVATLLAKFFDVDYDEIMSYHEDGFGFGAIAQALWMADALSSDTTAVTFDQILDAKRSGDYSLFTLPDGSTPTNWGQFRKAVLGKAAKKNLGFVMSGKAESVDDANSAITEHGNGKGQGNGQGHGKGKR